MPPYTLLIHWKNNGRRFEAACGVKNPQLWVGANEPTITCPDCRRLLRDWKAGKQTPNE